VVAAATAEIAATDPRSLRCRFGRGHRRRRIQAREFDILYSEGISREGDLLDLDVAHKIVEKSGSWFSYGDIRIGQGRETARVFLKDNPDLAAEIDHKLRVALRLVKPGPVPVEAPPADRAARTVAERAADKSRTHLLGHFERPHR